MTSEIERSMKQETDENDVTGDNENDKFIKNDDHVENGDNSVKVETQSGVPKDSGWAWVILVGATLAMLLLVGIVKCSGILFVAFQDRYQSSSAMTSLLSTVQNICQSSTSFLTMTFAVRYTTCRVLFFIGSIILSAAYVITSQATHIHVLLMSNGVLQGIGAGLMFPTSLTMVSLYFEKRRGFANSIAVSGGSIGGLLFAPLITYLLNTRGYQGCFLILAGFFLNGCVIALLFRPISVYTDRDRKSTHPSRQSVWDLETDLSLKEEKTLFDDRIDSRTDKTEVLYNKKCWKNDSVHSILDRSPIRWLDKSVKLRLLDPGVENKRSFSANDIRKTGATENTVSMVTPIAAKNILLSNSRTNSIFKSMEIYVQPLQSEKLVNVHSLDTIFLKQQREESGSVNTETSEREKKSSQSKHKLYTNPLFWAILLLGCLICSGTLIAPIYIAPYAKDIGMSNDDVATIVTALSCVDLFARIAVGCISDKGWLRRSTIVAIATLIVSIATSLLRFYTSYAMLLGYAVMLGLVSGAYFSLYAVIIIDYLTLDHFQTCLGILSAVHGFSIAAVFYFVGYLRDVTGSYIVPHNLIGATMCLGAIILFLLPVLERLQNKTRENVHLK